MNYNIFLSSIIVVRYSIKVIAKECGEYFDHNQSVDKKDIREIVVFIKTNQ
jgi:hypothetical protein